MIDEVVTRLNAQVSDLGNRAEGAASLAELMRAGKLPQHASAIVLPTGLRGKAPDVATGLYRQAFSETIAVILIARAHDQTGQRALDRIRPLIFEVISALAGWTPGAVFGEFSLSRGQLVSMAKGTLIYQIEFNIDDHLRIAT